VIVTTLPTAPLIGLTFVIVAAAAAALAESETRTPADDGAIQRSASAAAKVTARQLVRGAAPHIPVISGYLRLREIPEWSEPS